MGVVFQYFDFLVTALFRFFATKYMFEFIEAAPHSSNRIRQTIVVFNLLYLCYSIFL